MKKPVMPESLGRVQEKGSWLVFATQLMLLLLLCSCSLLPDRPVSPSPDQTLFEQGLDALSNTSTPEAFSRLTTEYPESPWTARAKSIVKIQGELQAVQGGRSQLAKQQGEMQQQLGQMQKKFDECRTEKEGLAGEARTLEQTQKALDTCRNEKERLVRDVRSLEKYTLKLKSLLAESGIVEPAPPVR